MKKIKLMMPCTLLLMYMMQAMSQKLPNSQTNGQWLPETVKIDGKLNEWDNNLKAYNKATRVEYLLANNGDQLYLAIRSKDVGTTAKILAGGITFTINAQGKKKATGPSITVPFTNSGYTLLPSGAVSQNFSVLTDSVAITSAIGRFKFIKVLNFKGITDTLISIYNEYEIKTRMIFTNDGFVCEIMIPKTFLEHDTPLTAFAYQIELNGVVPPPMSLTGIAPPPPIPAAGRAPSDIMYIGAEIMAATDFWGEYTLVKK